jgi:cytochrome P450
MPEYRYEILYFLFAMLFLTLSLVGAAKLEGDIVSGWMAMLIAGGIGIMATIGWLMYWVSKSRSE